MTKVVHCKSMGGYDVYIGRPSKWGNPFTYIKDKTTSAKFMVDTREEAIRLYELWILNQPHLLLCLHELVGRRLGCWCRPKACHGDVLVKLIQERGLE